MNVSTTINVPFFGLILTVEVTGTYTHDTFEPTSAYLDRIAQRHDPMGYELVGFYMPDVSDFYSAHAAAIDEAVAAELADHAEAAADTYESMRQDEIDDNAERARG